MNLTLAKDNGFLETMKAAYSQASSERRIEIINGSIKILQNSNEAKYQGIALDLKKLREKILRETL